MNRKYLRTNNNIKIITILLLLLLTVGYAILSNNLNINGTSKINNTTWNIYWDNLVATEGSVSADILEVDSAKTTVSYDVTLFKPGDFFEFTVDAINDGSIDAMIDDIISTIKIGDGTEQNISSSNIPPYLNYSVSYSDNIDIELNQRLNAGESETYKVRIEFKKDINSSDLPTEEKNISLKFQVVYVQKDSTAVYRPLPLMSDDSWDTIVDNVHNNTIPKYYTVGSEKEVDLGEFGKHKLRIANRSTTEECSSDGFSQTACGFVLEFTDMVTVYNYNSSNTNVGGWPISKIRTFVNNDIYNSLPESIKNSIVDTFVVSGHGLNDTSNFITTDKIYLLSPKEIAISVTYDTAANNTRVLDYYYVNNTKSSRIKMYNEVASSWWLRTSSSNSPARSYAISSTGFSSIDSSDSIYGVSPAFRIG